ncbi:MAG TPA: cytochrome c oxidase accessory protein CcoG [Polyangiaceae bacterium]|nr:cytochrome c oxidase accessory protein CcoG [Polyangiaceae bacterium]
MLQAPERVLPTLNNDGTRRWIRPRRFSGRFERARFAVAWGLMGLFIGLPFVRISGKPALLLDVMHRQFILFGRTFLPTDGVLLMLLLLTTFIAIILATALFGRVWCGWGCPQTVYMEFLFRPLERLIEGDHREQARLDREGANFRRVLKFVVYLVVSAFVANVFLAYFVGTDELERWVLHAPTQHWTGFLVMAVTTGLVFFDFGYFREQMCTVVCPYARLQSVLLDKKSLIVAYDATRGEPRGKKGKTQGDCVDCGVCVQACPTGIDIRNGLQLECIGCTQCIDGCDGIMDKLGRRRGLIRYTSLDALETRKFSLRSLIRPRVIIYPVLLLALSTALVVAASSRGDAEVSVLRGIGAPFVEQGDGVRNQLRVKIRNRSDRDEAYTLSLVDAPDATLVAPENPMHVAAGKQETTSLFVVAARRSFTQGERHVRVRVVSSHGFQKVTRYELLGPKTGD